MVDGARVDQAAAGLLSEMLAEAVSCFDGLSEVEMDDFWHT